MGAPRTLTCPGGFGGHPRGHLSGRLLKTDAAPPLLGGVSVDSACGRTKLERQGQGQGQHLLQVLLCPAASPWTAPQGRAPLLGLSCEGRGALKRGGLVTLPRGHSHCLGRGRRDESWSASGVTAAAARTCAGGLWLQVGGGWGLSVSQGGAVSAHLQRTGQAFTRHRARPLMMRRFL